jgi:capsular exopolysaccharide synthesis family protein
VPELTQKIANSVVKEYVNQGAEQEDLTIDTASSSMAKVAERLRKKLEESEYALQAYVEQSKAYSLDERQNTVVAKLKELSTKATEAKSSRITAETEYAQVQKLGTNLQALLTVPAVAHDPTVESMKQNLVRAEEDFAVLRQRYLEKNPKYILAKTQIDELQRDLATTVMNAVRKLQATVEAAIAAELALNEALEAQQASAMELNKLSIKYSVLNREVESDRALYDALLKGMKETSVAREMEHTVVVRLVQPAFLPEEPVWPKTPAIMAVSGLGGIFLGVLIILGFRASDNSIKTVDEAERMLGLSVLSVVPHIRRLKTGGDNVVVAENAKSEAAEAFRTLRTSLSMLDGPKDRHTYLFTSAVPSEGKTFCSVNFAASLAQIGLRTVIIDADLRRPAVETTLLGKETASPGVTDFLLAEKSLQEIVRTTKLEHLFFISAGTVAQSPAELLARNGLDTLIKTALEEYDRVVLDSAPITAVSDTLTMLKSVQTVCLVVRAAKTSSRYVLRSVQLLDDAEGTPAGVVLNQMPRGMGPGAYYDYSYRGDYGKDGVYGDR